MGKLSSSNRSSPASTEYQGDIVSLVEEEPSAVKALNIQLTALATDVHRAARAYVDETLAEPDLRYRCEEVFPSIHLQRFTSRR